MQKGLFIISLLISLIFCLSSNNISAQEAEPTYQSLIQSGDKEFGAKEYIKAKSYYQEALRQKPDDATAKNKLNKTLQMIRQQNQKEEVFYGYIDTADALYEKGDMEKALEEYNKALSILPNDSYALERKAAIINILEQEKEKIAAFNNTMSIADKLLSEERYAEATLQYEAALQLYPNNNNARNKYEEAKNKKEIYDNQVDNFEKLVAEAQQLTLRKRYGEAISKYQSALEIFPEDEDTKNEIARLTVEKSISDRYNIAIAQADSLYQEKSYEKALAMYQQSMTIIPDDAYSTGMINRINETLNSDEYKALQDYRIIIEAAQGFEAANDLNNALAKYNEALVVKPNDEYATMKIESINTTLENIRNQEELDARYFALIDKGTDSENNNDLQTALSFYSQAIELKPNGVEAHEKKDNVNRKIKTQESQLALEKQQLEENYNKAIQEGDKNFEEGKFNDAILSYQHALELKSNETYPQQKIADAQNQLAAIASEAERQERINHLLTTAEQYFTDKEYEKAESTYRELLQLEPDNSTALSQIKVIEDLYAEIARQKQQNYDAAMLSGNNFLNVKNYPDAIEQFTIALENKPGDETANQQLTLAEQLNQSRLNALAQEFQQLISSGDTQFESKNYDKAIDFYSKAIALNTGNSYPSDMIKKIGQILQENKLAELITSPVTLDVNMVKRFSFDAVDVTTRRNNYIFIKAKNLGTESFTLYISYGKDGSKNGGFMVTVPNNQDINDFIVRIGSQYKWFSEDNNWIEFTAEHGSLELTTIEISKSN